MAYLNQLEYEEPKICDICKRQVEKLYSCISCGRKICKHCYDSYYGICNKCEEELEELEEI